MKRGKTNEKRKPLAVVVKPIVQILNPGDSWICECGMVHPLGVYVAAHWRDELTHTCSNCGRKHSVCNGTLELI